MKTIRALGIVLGACAAVHADYETNFEPPLYMGSPSGVILTGQDGWTTPSGSVPYRVYTYDPNAWSIDQNPTGGTQFITGRPETFTAVRAQHDVDFSTRDQWLISYDFATQIAEPGSPAQNPIGSFSLQPSGTNRSFIAEMVWVDQLNPQLFHAQFDVFNPFGGGFLDQIPGPQWQNLERNHWYRQSILIEFSSNRILEVSLTDLATGQTATAQPVDWYMRGGQNPVEPLPTAVRFFTSGNDIDNLAAWDNLQIVPEPASVVALTVGALAIMARRGRRRACRHGS